MSLGIRKALSYAGSLKASYCHGGHYPKISRQTSSAYPEGCSGAIGVYVGSTSKRVSSTRFGHGFESVHGGHGYELITFGSHQSTKHDLGFHINSKETMRLLNDRLATYLEKVGLLEEENTELERKIKTWYEKHTPQTFPDSSSNFRTIEELRKQISEATVENSSLILLIDNARLAGEDLQTKYNMEVSLRYVVDADVSSLRRGLDGLTLERTDLELQLEHLQEELVCLKKYHEEDVNSLRTQLGARVNVEVKAAPVVNLGQALAEIREEYEKLMDRNIKEVENWFIAQSEELNCQVSDRSEHLESMKSKVIELRHTVQILEIDLQTVLSMNSALEETLAETETSYRSQLSQLQGLIDNIEDELKQLRYNLERQNLEYKILMDVKTRLEMEIATYRRLLEVEDITMPTSHSSETKESGGGLKIVSITEEFEDGRIVSTREQIHHIKS
ncbi:keratin, type I cytoskeletal 17-like [Spea bombifrons]|uniref:keratin, type I cytoskeletal 17-like n=1 Tax=Spea bombifrons TaxID=233779 RepID=UPI00234AD9E5|nr:keratin, type I cytoskeletal 17-like [Spea bombifrons]